MLIQGRYSFLGSMLLQQLKTKMGWPLEDNSFFTSDPDAFLVLTQPNYLHVRFPASTTCGLGIPSVVGYLTVTPWQHTAVAAH